MGFGLIITALFLGGFFEVFSLRDPGFYFLPIFLMSLWLSFSPFVIALVNLLIAWISGFLIMAIWMFLEHDFHISYGVLWHLIAVISLSSAVFAGILIIYDGRKR